MGPRPRELTVGCQAHEHSDLVLFSDNFLPGLGDCAGLRSLKLRVCLSGATPVDLSRVLAKHTHLSVLHLSKHTDDLIDETVVDAIARIASLKELYLRKRLSFPLVSFITTTTVSFPCLLSLTICADAGAEY
jgi:hypothetical protein